MLTSKKVLFLGGDSRQLELIKMFIDKKADISLIGFDNIHSSFSCDMQKDFSKEVFKDLNLLILPVVGCDEKGNVTSIFSNKKIVLTKEILQYLPKSCKIFTGIANKYLLDIFRNYKVVQIMLNDEVAIYNSIPTVEGALMIAIQNTDFTLHNCNVSLLGFGRVGMSLARVLSAIGAKVKVGIRKPEDEARAFEMGLTTYNTKDLEKHISDCNIIFNTVPALIITKSVLNQMRHDAVIIDLASKPGGVDFDFAKQRGIKAILAPSLPGIVAPKTAGQILFKAIERTLKYN